MIPGLIKTFPIIDTDNDGTIFHSNWDAIEIAVDGKLNINGTNAMTGPLLLASDPTLALHAATKRYVDSIATGLDVKKSVRAATTANVTLSGTQTIDTVGLIVGDRVLVKDQTDSKENGIYDVTSGAWIRSEDSDNSPVGEVTSGMFTFIEEGTANGTGWVLTTADPIVIGISNLIFSQFSNVGGGLVNIVDDITPQLGGELDAQNNKIINVTNPTAAQDVVTKDYVDTNFTSSSIDFLPLTGGTLSGNLISSGTYSVTSDGTVGAPAFRRSATGSGMYFTGSDVNISVGSSEQITVSPTVTTFNANVDIIGEPLFLPSGAEGQVFFNNATGTRIQESDFTVVEGRFVDTAQELIDAQLVFFTFADVFNTWYRFSHDATLTFPAVPAETTSWAFNPVTDQISSTVNSISYIGLVSNDFFGDYVFETQMSSSSTDDDAISILLAFTTEGTFGQPGYKEFTLSAMRTMGGYGIGGDDIWKIVYNFNQLDEFDVADGSATLTQWFKTDGTSGLGNQGWLDAGVGVPMKADRVGDIITVSTGEANTTLLLPATNLVIDLSSDIRLDKFRGQVRLGFGAHSQDAATWSDVNLVLSDNIIYDLASGDVYVYDGAAFVVVPGKNLIDDIGFGRIITNPSVGKSWFIDRNGNTPYVSNSTFGTSVSSVFGRTDAIVAIAGDYNASQITNTPAGNIAAVTVQAALDELDIEKATAAQGALADSAVQPNDNITTLINNAGYVTTSGLTNIVEDLTPQLGGALDAQLNKITSLGTPIISTDATTKAYVDSAVSSSVGLVEDFHGFMEAPTDKTYTLMLVAPYGFTISQIDLQTVSGSLVAQMRINNVLVGSTINVTSALSTNVVAFGVSIGQKVELVVSAGSSPVDFAFSIKKVRT